MNWKQLSYQKELTKNHLWNCLQLFNGLLNCRSSYSTMSSFQIHYKGNCTESECKTLIVLENYIYVITKIHVRYIKKFWIIWFVQERIIQNYCIIRYNGNGIIFSKCNNTGKTHLQIIGIHFINNIFTDTYLIVIFLSKKKLGSNE